MTSATATSGKKKPDQPQDQPQERSVAAGMNEVKRTRKELVDELGRLEAREEFLQAQRSEATRRLAEISREQDRIRHHLNALDRRGEHGEEKSA
jgi:chromosome segregation ATPase